MLVTVTFLDQWRSVGSRVGNGNVFGSIEVSWAPLLVFQGGFMVFHGFWLVFMVYQGGFMVFHGFDGFWLVFMVLQGGFMGFKVFGWFLLIFKVISRTPQNCILTQRSSLSPRPGGRHRT